MVTHDGTNPCVVEVAVGGSDSREGEKQLGGNVVAPYRGDQVLDEGRGARRGVTSDGAKSGGGMEVVVVVEGGDCGSSGPIHDGEKTAVKIENEKGRPPSCYHCYTDDWLVLSHNHSLPPLSPFLKSC